MFEQPTAINWDKRMTNTKPRHNWAIRGGAILLLAATQSACAAMISGAMNASVTEDEIRTKTAQYFSVEPARLEIAQVTKGPLSTDYKTTVNGQIYNCSLYYGAVTCRRPGES